MRNKYPGICYKCGKHVEAGEGHFERNGKTWRVQHAEHTKKLSFLITPEETSQFNRYERGAEVL